VTGGSAVIAGGIMQFDADNEHRGNIRQWRSRHKLRPADID
jgi:hypothetical protein